MNEAHLKPPASIQEQPSKRLSFDLARSTVSKDKIADLEKQVKLMLEDSKTNTQVLRRRLNALNDMLEGVVQEVQYPFPNASNVDTKMMIGTARTMRSTMVRAIFQDPDRSFVVSTDQDVNRDQANQVEGAFNWKAAHENNLIEALKDSIIPIFRDGTAFIQGVWETIKERVIDYKSYATVEAFLADYPDAETAGVGEDKFTEMLVTLAEPDACLDVSFERDMIRRDSPWFSVVSLARFFWYPLSAKRMEDCEMYGVRMDESEATVKKKAKTKEYFADVVTDCLSANKQGTVIDLWDRQRDFIEGISRNHDTAKRKDFENFRLVLTVDLDDDDIPEKYMGVFNLAAGRFLNFDRYRIRNNVDFLVPLRFMRRDDRLLGPSLAYDGMDLFQEITDLHRHRNNARLITDAPGFKAEDDLKDACEQGLREWRPGMVLWLPKGRLNGVEQFAYQNRSNTQNSLDEENLLIRAIEFIVGPTQGLSGQETQGDAGAPATKHLSKIRQAGFRVDDYIDEFKRPFPEIGKLGLALYYQYGQRELAYQSKGLEGKSEGMTAARDLFGMEGLTMELNAKSVTMSPEFEMERIMALRAEAAQNPAVMAFKPQVHGILWDRFVTASRTQNPEELKLGQQAFVPPPPPVEEQSAPGAKKPAANGNSVGSGVPPLKSLIASLGMGNPTERRER